MFLLLAKLKTKKLEKSDFGGCQLPKVGKKREKKIAKFLYLVFIV